MKKLIGSLAAAVALSGCAVHETYHPVVDRQGDYDAVQYQKDLRDCRQYAAKVNPQSEAIAGAIAGALITVATVALTMDTGDYLSRSAGVGAFAGALGGAGKAANTQRSVIQRCLGGRGYSVLK